MKKRRNERRKEENNTNLHKLAFKKRDGPRPEPFIVTLQDLSNCQRGRKGEARIEASSMRKPLAGRAKAVPGAVPSR